jgi:hypothetical protein
MYKRSIKINKNFKFLPLFLLLIIFTMFLSSCKDNSVTTQELTDEEFMKTVVMKGFSSSQNDEDNLMSQDSTDLDDCGAVYDYDGGGMNPIDSLKRWGRKITGVNVNFTITWSGDTLAAVNVTRTINGIYIIIGWQNNQPDSVTKPYTEVFYRTIVFKRVNRTLFPRLNWRLYKVSMLSGGTTQPQAGSSQVKITKVEAVVNTSPPKTYTFNGPDFTQNVFTTRYFGGSGIPVLNRNTQVTLKVYITSQQSPTDYVAWHWARNTFGFHRIPFTLESQTGTGTYYRVYTRTFNIYGDHVLGVFNGYISASTHESLYDDDVTKFASTEIGSPYIVAH